MTRAPIGALVIFGLDPGLSFSLRAALRQAVGFAVHFQDVDVVGQAVEERAGEALFAERGGPLIERQVRGDDGGAALIALTDQFEQQLGAGLSERDKAQLIDDQQLVAGELPLQTQEALVSANQPRWHRS